MNGYEPRRTDKNGAPSALNVHTTPFLSIRIRSYPFKQEPHVSVPIPNSIAAVHNRQGIPTEPDGSSMNGYELRRTDKNGAPSALNVHTTPFLSVRIRSYPFKQEPHVSVVIPNSIAAQHHREGIPTEPDGSSMNGYEPGRTDKNGAPSALYIKNTPFLSIRIRSYPFKQEPHVSILIPANEHHDELRTKSRPVQITRRMPAFAPKFKMRPTDSAEARR